MANKKNPSLFSFLRVFLYWLLLIASILTICGLGGGLAGAWSNLPSFFLALSGVFQGIITPWAIAAVLAVFLITVVLTFVWVAHEFYGKNREESIVIPVSSPTKTTANASPTASLLPTQNALQMQLPAAQTASNSHASNSNSNLPKASSSDSIPVDSKGNPPSPAPNFDLSLTTPSPLSPKKNALQIFRQTTENAECSTTAESCHTPQTPLLQKQDNAPREQIFYVNRIFPKNNHLRDPNSPYQSFTDYSDNNKENNDAALQSPTPSHTTVSSNIKTPPPDFDLGSPTDEPKESRGSPVPDFNLSPVSS